MVGHDHDLTGTPAAPAMWRPQERDEQPSTAAAQTFGAPAQSYAFAPQYAGGSPGVGAARFGGAPATPSSAPTRVSTFGSADPLPNEQRTGSSLQTPTYAPAAAAYAGATSFGTFGSASPAPSAPMVWETPRTDGVAVAGFVLSLLLWPLGLVLSLVGLGRTKDGRAKGHGLAVAGVVISLVSAVLAVMMLSVAMPVFTAQQHAAQASQVRSALTSTSVWAQNVVTDTGAYPSALDATTPRTGAVVVGLVPDPAGGPPCLQAVLGEQVMHTLAGSGAPQEGACS